MGLHQPTIVYDLPEMDLPAIFTSIPTGNDEGKALRHAEEFLGRAFRAQERPDWANIVETVRIRRGYR